MALVLTGCGGGSAAGGGDPYDGAVFRLYRSLLAGALRFRWPVMLLCAAALIAGLYGLARVRQSFFPSPDRPQFMVDCFLPSGTHLEESEAFAATVGKYIQSQPGVTHATSFIGGGGRIFSHTRNSCCDTG